MRRSFFLAIALSVMLILSACSGFTGTATQAAAAPTTAAITAATTAPATGSLDVITVNIVDNATYGKILVNSLGITLYLYTRDTPNTSACYDQCATNWPPLTVTGTPYGGAEIDTALLGTTQRTDGTRQVTYNGWPLYTYINDKQAGDTTGQNTGSVWFVVSPAGEKITAASDNTASAADTYGKGAADASAASGGVTVTEGKGVQISIANFAFSPADIKIHVGTTITWTNSDSALHTVSATDGSFESGTLNQGGTFSFTFTKEGDYAYFCANHASMKAMVSVVP